MNRSLSDRLRLLREQNGYTQQAVAEYLQIDKSTYAHYESGRRTPDAAKLGRLAEYYHLVDEILGVGVSNGMIPEERRMGFAGEAEHGSVRFPGDIYREKLELEGKILVTRFPIICPHEKIDMSRIYPTMQPKVARIFQAMQPEKRVVSIVLFGSSVTQRCHVGSDLDLAVRLTPDCALTETKNEVSLALQESTDWNADILWFDRLSKKDRIYSEILKGVQIA